MTRGPWLGLLLALTGCAGLNLRVDSWALVHKAGTVADHPGPRAPLPFRDEAELERLTRPTSLPEVAVTPLARHRLDDPLLVQEQLHFPSVLALRHPAGPASAYLYRHGRLGARPLVVWVPGQHVSGADFPTLRRLFAQVLQRGLDLVFFVPPYHLDRTPPGFGSGDAFMATDFPDHLTAFAQELGDLRRLLAWLRAQGVRELGAVGASMGAGLLLRIATWEPAFDFLTVLQPVLDWNGLLARPEMAPARQRLAEQGYEGAEEAVYAALDPRGATPLLGPSTIALFYGRFDGIAGPEAAQDLAVRWGLHRVRAYDRGHVLLPVWTTLARDLGESLERDLWALQARRWLRTR